MAAATLLAQADDAHRRGEPARALALVEQALALAPDDADAWNLAGIVQHTRREHAAALAHFRRALALGGGAGVLVNIGFAHQALDQPDEALRAYTAALKREPGLAIAWQKLGALQEATGERERAIDCYRRAVQLQPDDLKSLGDGLMLRRLLADWTADPVLSPAALVAGFARAARADFSPGLLLALPEATPGLQRQAAALFARTQWGARFTLPPLAPPARAHPGRRRIGYLSADFQDHAVSYLVGEVIAAHDREAVEVFVYAYRAAAAGDPWRQAAMAAGEHFADLDGLDDEAAAARIAADDLDVLVDLTGYTGGGRLGILARRPAPVIAHWIGFIGSLGESRLADYVIADAVALPPALEAGFSEAPARLPRCFQPNGRLQPLPAPPTRAEAGLPEHATVFCSFNQTWKLGPDAFDDWCTILRGVPGSVLWLVAPKDLAGLRNLRGEAAARGIDGARLVFAPPTSRDAHLARIPLADLALDTWPYNSGTTASDALRAGVPLLAFPGETFVGRMAASLLQAAGLGDCVLPDRDAVIARAIELGLDARQRQALRQRVPAAVAASGLYDPPAFARDLERLYAAMHGQGIAATHRPITLERAAG